MSTTTEDVATTWTALVSVRVPRDDGAELLESTRRRLEAARSVDDVGSLAVSGLEPALSATTVRVEARIAVSEPLDRETVTDRLAAAPGVGDVEVVVEP